MAVSVHTDDQKYLLDKEPVTYVSINRVTGNNVDKAMTDAVQYPISKREVAASYGALQAGDVVWTVSRTGLDGVKPKLGDLINPATGDDGSFVVMEAKRGVGGNFWVLTTRNIVISEDLCDRIAVYRRPVTIDGAGRRKVGDAEELASNLPGRVQPETFVRSEDLGVERLQKRYRVYVLNSLDLLLGDEMRLADGRILEIEEASDSERIELVNNWLCVDRGARWN